MTSIKQRHLEAIESKNPKEMAEELIERFQYELAGALYSPHNNISAKQCAIIAVEEIIKACTKSNPKYEETSYWHPIDFYKQVLEELKS